MRIVEKKGGILLPDPCVECGRESQLSVEFEPERSADLKLCTACLRVLVYHAERYEPELDSNKERGPE